MSNRIGRAATVIACLSLACAAGCSSQHRVLQQQQEKLESLAASARLVADDYLAGRLSPTYTRTALDAIFRQVEQQRAVLAAKPATLADPRGAALSQQAEQLSRLVAQMEHDVAGADRAALGSRRGGIPLLPAGQ